MQDRRPRLLTECFAEFLGVAIYCFFVSCIPSVTLQVRAADMAPAL